MFRWLERLLSRPPPPRTDEPRSIEALLAAIAGPLADGSLAGELATTRAWCDALDELCARDAQEFLAVHEARITEQLAEFYGRHPLTVSWPRDYELRVVDPLGLTTERLVCGEPPEFVAWARLLRSLVIVSDEVVFHHGCRVADLLALLRDPAAPRAIEALVLPSLDYNDHAEIDALVDELCQNPRLRGLEHLTLRPAPPLDGRHIEDLAAAPWAGSLRSLDLCEQMVDWSVDRPEAERHAALRALGRFTALEHLSMYNNFGEAAELAAFLDAQFPALTHLSLGHLPPEGEFLERLATTDSLPRLQELRISGGPPNTDPAWGRAVERQAPIFLHGRRVGPEYPHRG
jgi:hypothetical protein